MRLATVRDPGGSTRLFGRDPRGELYFDLGTWPDVRALYSAGPDAVRAAQRIVDRGGGKDQGRDLASLDLAPPVTEPRSIVCVGRNYREHIEEGNAPVPEFPVLFSKFPNTLVGHKAAVIRHSITRQLDYEGELALVIARTASNLSTQSAMSFVAGYTVVNDISARDLQLGDLQWIRGKSLDTFCPLGPVFVSADEIPDVSSLRIETRVNGELRQNAPVSDMLFPIPELLRFITEAITLQPGDLVLTGTPSGTAFGMKPQVWLEPGDVVDVRISGIGTLSSVIKGAKA
jgi:2-keto-4-pentenoate hydratase/2-oxohepta-3-ene-1,7-dioic acid hydratase in catechol pathway